MDKKNIFVDLLQLLGVRHTEDDSNSRYANMPFKTLFGLKKLLQEYGIDSKGIEIPEEERSAILPKLPTPFIAATPAGLIIIKEITPKEITYISEGEEETTCAEEFLAAWDGMAFFAIPDKNSIEPDYRKHHFESTLETLSKWGLGIGALLIFSYFFITRGLYDNIWSILLVSFNLVGLYVTFLLVQKSLNIHNRHADNICGILQEGGCDDILKTDASKLFGVFSWSEVGFGYFSVSLATLLLFPELLGYLALFNACCLPYTIWSISYQKFVAKKWCTLCVTTQLTLWLLFFCYLFRGAFNMISPFHWGGIALLVGYVTVVLLFHQLMKFLKSYTNEN